MAEPLGTCDLREINAYPHHGAEPHPYRWYCSRWTPVEPLAALDPETPLTPEVKEKLLIMGEILSKCD